MELNDLISLVKNISAYKPGHEADSLIDRRLSSKGMSRVSLLDQIEKVGATKVFDKISLEDRKQFLANMSSAKRHPGYGEIEKISHAVGEMAGGAPAVAGTTTANVGAFPVPLGQESPGRKKKKHEAVSRRMGIGAYELSEIIDADEELKEYK